jgi:hypothetical protein
MTSQHKHAHSGMHTFKHARFPRIIIIIIIIIITLPAQAGQWAA